jgi:hypothetical protein
MRNGWIVGVVGVLGVGLMSLSLAAFALETGLVTALSGNVQLLEEKTAAVALKPFVKVREGDRLALGENTRLQLVYFEGGRQETWQGSGTLLVGSQASKVVKGGLQAETKSLPSILLKQLSKTPSSDGNVRAGMVRLRSMPNLESLESVESQYAALRQEAAANDRSPELYLLASYFELRAFDKVEALLRQMRDKTPKDSEIEALNALYVRAMAEANSAEQR